MCGWFGVKQEKHDRMYPYAHRYGFFLGFLGVMPVIGDVAVSYTHLSPLVKAPDAVEIDNSHLTPEQQNTRIDEIIAAKLKNS